MIIASEDCEMGHVEERLGQGGMTTYAHHDPALRIHARDGALPYRQDDLTVTRPLNII